MIDKGKKIQATLRFSKMCVVLLFMPALKPGFHCNARIGVRIRKILMLLTFCFMLAFTLVPANQ